MTSAQTGWREFATSLLSAQKKATGPVLRYRPRRQVEEGVTTSLPLAAPSGRFMTALSRSVRQMTRPGWTLDEPPPRGELLGPQAQAALAPDARPRDADVLERRRGVEVLHARDLADRRAPAPAPLRGVERGRLDDLDHRRAAVRPREVDEHQVAGLIGGPHERLALGGEPVGIADDGPRRRREAGHELPPVLDHVSSWWRSRSRSSANCRAS